MERPPRGARSPLFTEPEEVGDHIIGSADIRGCSYHSDYGLPVPKGWLSFHSGTMMPDGILLIAAYICDTDVQCSLFRIILDTVGIQCSLFIVLGGISVLAHFTLVLV